MHVGIFGETLIFGVSATYLLEHPTATSKTLPEDAPEALKRQQFILGSARWTTGATLAMVLVKQSVIALMNKSLDDPGSMKVSNRYIRLMPRALVVIIALCLPIADDLTSLSYLGIIVACLMACLLWEWCASLEKSGGLIEP